MAQTIDIEPLLAPWLAGLAVVTDLAGGRVYPWGRVPQGADFPHLLYHQVGGRRLRSRLGPTTRVTVVRVQLDAVARTWAEARELGSGVWLSVEGTLSRSRLDGHLVQTAFVRDGRDWHEPPAHGDEVAEPRYTLDVEIWFEEG